MKTSQTIKQGQYHPVKGSRTKKGLWVFPSETRDRVSYTVSRDGRFLQCGCPSLGLCKHITSVVVELASRHYDVIQVWTDEEDAKRQKRSLVQMYAKDRPFWVTLAFRAEKQIAKCDQEIARIGQQIADARHRKLMTGNGQIRSDAQKEMDQLYVKLNDLMDQRAGLVTSKNLKRARRTNQGE